MKSLACLLVAFGMVAIAPASRALELPKLEAFASVVETAKRQSRAKRNPQQCYNQCVRNCAPLRLFCTSNCRCECYGRPEVDCIII